MLMEPGPMYLTVEMVVVAMMASWWRACARALGLSPVQSQSRSRCSMDPQAARSGTWMNGELALPIWQKRAGLRQVISRVNDIVDEATLFKTGNSSPAVVRW